MRSFFVFVAGVASMISVTATADLAVDHFGNLFLTASNNNSILKFSSNGTKSTFAKGVEGALAFDTAGNLFIGVSDATGTIFKLAPDGTKSTFAAGVGNPVSLTFDPAGNLYAYDLNSGSIFKFTPNGDKSTFAKATKQPGQMFADSTAIACDGAGNLFAADSKSDTIFKFAPDGIRTTFATNIKATNLAVDKANNLVAANFWSKDVYKFSPDGRKSTLRTALNAPEGLAVDSAGNLFVYDGPVTIYKIAPDGKKVVIAEDRPEMIAEKSQPEPEPGSDSSEGLPPKYAENYLVASATISPDRKLAVIYPTRDSEDFPEGKNYMVSLKPFAILGSLPFEEPYFQHMSNSSLSSEWSADKRVAIVTEDGKWAPRAILVVQFANGKIAKTTDLVPRVEQVLLTKLHARPDFRNTHHLYFQGIDASLDGASSIKVSAEAQTAAQHDLGLTPHTWVGTMEGTWDTANAKFVSPRVSGKIRKPAKED